MQPLVRWDEEVLEDDDLKGELDTRLLLRTWLKDEEVRRTGVW
jgi:hypothetical protein